VKSRLTGLLMIAMFIAGCGTGAGSSPQASAAVTSQAPTVGAASSASTALTKLSVGLGYIQSVQFAPFYLAQGAGYYRDAGLDVSFQNKIDPDLVTLVGTGAIGIGLADGTSVIPAASQGIPIKYIATIYGQFPSIVFAKASSGIKAAADLKGKKVGTPGKYGSSWIMLQALLGSANLTVADVQVVEYPDFGQRAAVEQGAVDSATGFTNNEPVQMQLDGQTPVVLHVDAITPLPGPGLIAATKTIASKKAAVTAFVAATLRAMKEIVADRTKGLDASIAAVPDLASGRTTQDAILKATVDTWGSAFTDQHGLGAIDIDAWTRSIAYMAQLKLVANPVTSSDVVETSLLPGG
jgi:NitT/TauT family transport system substrate-binding protein